MNISEIIAAPQRSTLGTQEIVFQPITLAMEAAFETKLLAKTKATLTVVKDMVSADEYIQLLKAVSEGYSLGEYKLMGKHGLAALQTVDGIKVLVSLLTGLPEAKAYELVRDFGAEVGNVLQLLMKENLGVE